MVVQEVFEVLYSPVKAFKKIIEKPDFKGILLVFVLAISSTLVAEYVLGSKLFIENRLPIEDDWTEALTNAHNWTSNGFLSLDSSDYKLGNIEGNHSIACSAINQASIWMKLTDIEPVNCSNTGYIELFFWTKWTNDNGSPPSSGTMKLFSNSDDSYFEYENTLNLFSANSSWTNTTLNVGSDQGWSSNNSPDWQNITGIEIRLDWESASNLSLRIDGLFFRNYISVIATGGFETAIFSIAFNVVLNFATNWILWAGILLIVAKLFQEDVGHWNVFFVIIGYSFITTVVYTLISAVPISTLPILNVPWDPIALEALLDVAWRPLLAHQIWQVLPLIGGVWVATLSAIVIRQMKETTWSRAISISGVAFGITYILLPLMLSSLRF